MHYMHPVLTRLRELSFPAWFYMDGYVIEGDQDQKRLGRVKKIFQRIRARIKGRNRAVGVGQTGPVGWYKIVSGRPGRSGGLGFR